MLRSEFYRLVILVEVEMQTPRLDGSPAVSEVALDVAKHPHDRVLMHCIRQLVPVLDDVMTLPLKNVSLAEV